VAALERPANLKKWASDLVRIVEGQGPGLFDGFDFGPAALTRVDLTRILKKISGCGSVVELRAALDRGTGEMGDPVVHAANFCGQHSICPYCAGRVQDRRGARFREPIQAVAREYPFAYMVTATIPPCETWREDLSRLVKGWQAFRRMGQVRKRKKKDGTIVYKRSGGEWAKIGAGLAKIELKRGTGSGLPHCHYHALIFTKDLIDYRVWKPGQKHLPPRQREPMFRLPRPFKAGARFRPVAEGWGVRDALTGWIPASKLTCEWFRATGGAVNFQVDPLKYRPEDKRAGKSYEESIFEQSREVLKYATKFDSRPELGAEKLFARDFVGIRDATYSRRLFVSYGDFRKVGGNDFEGGGPHISEGPAIFESRWRGVMYSDLVQRSRPIFPNSDKTPAVTARLTELNRALGQARRMRSAVVGSKNHYRETGELRPAFFARREYLADGAFKDWPMVLEVPAAVAADPSNMGTWESWVDDISERGRRYYEMIRERLSVESLEGLDGTIEEQNGIRDASFRAWLNSDAYAAEVVRLFRQTLESSRQLISESS
jgi:hypothetical protein